MSKLTPEQIDLIYQANLKDTESKSYKLAIVNKIPLEQTGFEALACHRKEQGEGFVKLLHLILINLYLEYQDFEEIFLKYFVDYVNESIPKRIISIDKENLRKK